MSKLAAIICALATAVTAFSEANPLVGRWTNGRISTIQYQNRVTGAPAPTNGNHFAYEFNADGSYVFTGLMQSVMYQCTTTVFSRESGRYTLAGDQLTLHPERNPYKMTNSCSPSMNREAPGKLVERSFRVRVAEESSRPRLDLVGPDQSVQSFQRER
jgi:hypothetical protein